MSEKLLVNCVPLVLSVHGWQSHGAGLSAQTLSEFMKLLLVGFRKYAGFKSVGECVAQCGLGIVYPIVAFVRHGKMEIKAWIRGRQCHRLLEDFDGLQNVTTFQQNNSLRIEQERSLAGNCNCLLD